VYGYKGDFTSEIVVKGCGFTVVTGTKKIANTTEKTRTEMVMVCKQGSSHTFRIFGQFPFVCDCFFGWQCSLIQVSMQNNGLQTLPCHPPNISGMFAAACSQFFDTRAQKEADGVGRIRVLHTRTLLK